MARTKTTNKGVKKGTRRGPYKKKKAPEFEGVIEAPGFIATYSEPQQIDSQVLEYSKQIPVKEESWEVELNELKTVCTIFSSWSEEQKNRCFNFIKSKYSNYFS